MPPKKRQAEVGRFSERLSQWVKMCGLDKRAFAKHVGIPEDTFRGYTLTSRRGREPSVIEHLRNIRLRTGVSLHWLLDVESSDQEEASIREKVANMAGKGRRASVRDIIINVGSETREVERGKHEPKKKR